VAETPRRLVAVLGYSGRTDVGIHDTCLARVREAEELVQPGDVVLFTGCGRGQSEAELMAREWRGERSRLLLDHDSRTTRANARAAARYAAASGAEEVVAVTSSWHRRRAEILLRAALRGTGIRGRVVGARGPGSVAAVAREGLAALALPVQLAATLAGGRVRRG
jgi:uncharacterized SAM-binding protein YcdF (DUF218 family)